MNRRQRIAAQRHLEHYPSSDIPFDIHWVIRGDTAQKALEERGYLRLRTEMRHGKRWDLMGKNYATAI